MYKRADIAVNVLLGNFQQLALGLGIMVGFLWRTTHKTVMVIGVFGNAARRLRRRIMRLGVK